jgi:Mn2+/Fe2+ NRAMP family transporter
MSNTNPIQALIYAAVINGIIVVPMLFIIVRLGNDRNVLRGETNGIYSNVVGWITFSIMAISVVFIWVHG